MENLEFVMSTDLAALPKSIDFNFDSLKAALNEGLEFYNNLVVTEDSIKSAKEDRAKLNKLRDALEAKRKDVKNECMVPYTDFEKKVKELVGMIDKPIAAIDTQLKGYEDKRRADKRAEIEGIYKEAVGDLADILPFEKVWEDTWYNVSVTMKKVREAIAAKVGKTRSDLATLSTVESEFAEAVKLKYLETGDLGAALQERARLQEQAKRLREYEERKAVERAVTPEPEAEAPAPAAATFEPGGGAAVEETIYLLRFECHVTKGQAAGLAQYMKDHNISYRRI